MDLLRLRRKNEAGVRSRLPFDRIEIRSVAFVDSPTVLLKHSISFVSRHVDHWVNPSITRERGITASIEVQRGITHTSLKCQ
jgi:hypothetical protein